MLKKAIMYFLLLSIGYGGFLLWQLFHEPAVGTVDAVKPLAEDTDFDAQNEQRRYDGKYISFIYSASFVEKQHDISDNGPIREMLFLVAMDSGKRIAVTIEDRPEKTLDASPAFLMRSKNPETYRQETFESGDFYGFIFEKNSQVFEETAFFRSGGYIVSVAVSSALSLEGLREQLFAVLETIRLRE